MRPHKRIASISFRSSHESTPDESPDSKEFLLRASTSTEGEQSISVDDQGQVRVRRVRPRGGPVGPVAGHRQAAKIGMPQAQQFDPETVRSFRTANR